ncbi:hypothetical protein, partial [Jeotgalibaca porci]|uniref:hypothetical protein n=1 Tax=Jeotgalibaca porci TaxID=1868793 RepID=UPI00359FF07B
MENPKTCADFFFISETHACIPYHSNFLIALCVLWNHNHSYHSNERHRTDRNRQLPSTCESQSTIIRILDIGDY